MSKGIKSYQRRFEWWVRTDNARMWKVKGGASEIQGQEQPQRGSQGQTGLHNTLYQKVVRVYPELIRCQTA